jgi:hypothetical protein
MIVDVLAADTRQTVRPSIIAPAHDPCLWNIRWEEITEPVDVVYRP